MSRKGRGPSRRQTGNSVSNLDLEKLTSTSDPDLATAAVSEPDLVMAASSGLQASEPPAWFSSEMQKFAQTIQASITTSLDKLNETMNLTNTKVAALEAKGAEYETSFADMQRSLTALEKKHIDEVAELKEKLDDFENRQRRNNLRIMGFPMGVEGNDAVGFLEKWLPDILGLSDPIEIERAHRSLPLRRPGAGNDQAAPRAFVVKFLRYRDVTRILEAARKKKELSYGNSKVMIFPDLSPTLHQKRMAFNTLKRQLRQAGVRYGMLYPATFRVDLRSGGSKSFTSVEAAHTFLRREYPEVM